MRQYNVKNLLIKHHNFKETEDEEYQKIEENMINNLFDTIYKKNMDKNSKDELSQIFDIEKIGIYSINKKAKQAEAEKKYLNDSLKSLNLYYFPELVMYVINNAHNQWMVENNYRIEKGKISKAEKFVPMELLNWKNVEPYWKILKNVFDCLDVKYDDKEIKKEFIRSKLVFLFENGIVSKEALQEKLPELQNISIKSQHAKKTEEINHLEDKLAKSYVQNKIIEEMLKTEDINLANQLKKALAVDKGQLGFIDVRNPEERRNIYKFEDNIRQRKFGIKKEAHPRIKMPINKTLFKLARIGYIWADNLNLYNYKYVDISGHFRGTMSKPLFIPCDQCTDEQKKIAEKRNIVLQKFVNKVKSTKGKKYEEPGVITFVMPDRTVNSDLANSKEDESSIIQIEITQKELANLGILPEELGWESKRRGLVNSSRSVLVSSSSEKENSNVEFEEESFFDRVKVDLNNQSIKSKKAIQGKQNSKKEIEKDR